jgi:hypothetical protein
VADFGGCTTIIWGGGHSLERSGERHVTPEDGERLIRSPDRVEPGKKKRRWEISGCVNGRDTTIVVNRQDNGVCHVVTVIRTRKRCS